ncbi:MAG: hypothetical protein E7425_06990 [Ruminococcaceae bacterium]|nr:hypothetical protein [Oscillospiraceae bacterium]
MHIAVIGQESAALCLAAGCGVLPLRSLAEAQGQDWDLLALLRDASACPAQGCLRTRCLLLPGDSGASLALSIQAGQLVGYGFSPRHTLTLSSLNGPERLLCLQRAVLTLDGTLLEPQELPLPQELSNLDAEQALLAAGVRLLCARGAVNPAS